MKFPHEAWEILFFFACDLWNLKKSNFEESMVILWEERKGRYKGKYPYKEEEVITQTIGSNVQYDSNSRERLIRTQMWFCIDFFISNGLIIYY